MSDFNPSREYDRGLRGAYVDPRQDEICADSILRGGGDPDGTTVSKQWGLSGLGEGKLTATWLHVERLWPGCWPGPPQDRGDCVSWAVNRAALTTMSCEILDGKPDEASGKIEGQPEVSPEGVANCVLSSEASYWWRGWSGEGWTCSGAAKAMMNDCGLWLRKPYPEIGLDLTRYDGKTAGKWGATRPPEQVRNIGREHLVRTATFLKNVTEIRDYLAAGYGVFFCSSLAWRKERDEFGFAKVDPSNSWAHAQAAIGWDERPEVVRKYGEPLCAIANSWGSNWQRGGRNVMGTDLYIPHGCYWTLASAMAKCSPVALSGVAGWPPRRLKDYGAKGNV